MTEPLPKWEMLMYARLWNSFKNKNFTFDQAKKLLKKKNERAISVFLSDLKKFGWLIVSLDPKDSRKRLYKLKSPEQAIKEME